MELNRILAATDFSERGAEAVSRAVQLAIQHSVVLHLIHVIPAISWKMFGRAFLEHPLITEKHLFDAAHDRIQQLADEIREMNAIEVHCYVDIGQAYERIAEYARSENIDLTILGPHADNLARDLFVGSTARRFLQQGRKPALISRGRLATRYQRVLLAVDFSNASRIALQAALRVAPGATIHALHVYDVLFEGKMRYAGVEQNVIQRYRDAAGDEAWRELRAFLDDCGAGEHVVPLVENGHPSRAILDKAQNLQADLIVMGKRGRSELEELFLGSVTEGVLSNFERDLLLVSE